MKIIYVLMVGAACSWFALVACGPSVETKPVAVQEQVASPTSLPSPAPRTDEPMDEALTVSYRACSTDADCVLALNGCCDCANGGRDIAVSRAKLAEFKAQFRCTGACTERGGTCGKGRIACENKVCMYRP